MRIFPFYVCRKYGWNLRQDHDFMVRGCNIDGKLDWADI